jgi:hypothetical protein
MLTDKSLAVTYQLLTLEAQQLGSRKMAVIITIKLAVEADILWQYSCKILQAWHLALPYDKLASKFIDH